MHSHLGGVAANRRVHPSGSVNNLTSFIVPQPVLEPFRVIRIVVRWVKVIAIISLLAWVGACDTTQPASILRQALSAPPAGQLLSRLQTSNLNDFHITYTAHLWAEGPLSRSNGSITVRF